MSQLIGIREVCRRTGRSKSTIRRYLMLQELEFPKPITLGPRDRAWYADEVDAWIDGLSQLFDDEHVAETGSADSVAI